jgi:hypothetical protein
MLPVSLDCPFFIAPSVFSNIEYIQIYKETGNSEYTMLEKTEGAIKNGQSRETGNIEYTRKRQTKQKTQYVLDTTLCKQAQIM